MKVVYPKYVPMMILPNIFLLPNQLLPLHIFEDKYKAMIEDVIDGDRIFGICDKTVYKMEDKTEIASVGLLHACEKQDEGTSDLMLLGLQKVKILNLNNEKIYPRVEIDPIDTQSLEPRQQDVVIEHILEKVEPIINTNHQITDVINKISESKNIDLLLDYSILLTQKDPKIQKKMFQTIDIKEKMRLFESIV